MNYSQVKTENQNKIDTLITECGIFFAFSNEQFKKNKTSLSEGDSYVSIGNGGYCSKSNVDKFIKGLNDVSTWRKETIKEHNLQEDEILYELINHECFYVGCIDDAFEILKEHYTYEEVKEVYIKNKEQYS